MRITPENITKLKVNEIFVFGSNLSGIHGKGAAKLAMSWGARRGNGIGRYGQTYAIPTRGRWRPVYRSFKTLGVDEIGEYVYDFLVYASKNPKLIFLVTKIGCGHAGLEPHHIGPLFGAYKPIPENVSLPKEFWPFCEEARPG